LHSIIIPTWRVNIPVIIKICVSYHKQEEVHEFYAVSSHIQITNNNIVMNLEYFGTSFWFEILVRKNLPKF